MKRHCTLQVLRLAAVLPPMATAFTPPCRLHHGGLVKRLQVATANSEPCLDNPSVHQHQTHPQHRHPEPLAELPMKRLKLPKGAAGNDLVAMPIKIDGQGPFDFMLDTALTSETITPELQKTLGMSDDNAMKVEGLAAGGSKGEEKLVMLEGVSLSEEGQGVELPPLHAIVTDFPEEKIDPAQKVDGMVGIETLELFYVDFDFPAGVVRLWPSGTAASVAEEAGMISVPAAIVNDETYLLAIRITSEKSLEKKLQPFLGIVDVGASFSTCSWEAAKLLAELPRNKIAYIGSPTVMAVGVDNKPIPMPMKHVTLTFLGGAPQDEDSKVQFEQPPPEWKPWNKVKVGVGDLPVCSLALGDKDHPFKGPAAIIGLDVLSQRKWPSMSLFVVASFFYCNPHTCNRVLTTKHMPYNHIYNSSGRMIIETCIGTMHCKDRRRRIFIDPDTK